MIPIRYSLPHILDQSLTCCTWMWAHITLLVGRYCNLSFLHFCSSQPLQVTWGWTMPYISFFYRDNIYINLQICTHHSTYWCWLSWCTSLFHSIAYVNMKYGCVGFTRNISWIYHVMQSVFVEYQWFKLYLENLLGFWMWCR